MKASLARRLFRTIFAIGLINVIVTLVATEFIYEDMEDTILRQELSQERVFLEAQIQAPVQRSWSTALLTALYVPDGVEPDALPAVFLGRELPFSAEVDFDDKAYLISIERTASPPGVLYLAQDITLLERREDTLQLGMIVLGSGMLLFGFLLARVGTQRIVRPLQNLTRQIGGLRPGTPFARLETPYQDEELVGIAATLNALLDALDAYVQREKSLVSLASHELRTPVAVIVGALDVLEQRNSMSAADRNTVARIRRAADEMRADIEALLKLARRSEDEPSGCVELAAVIRAVVSELEGSAPEQAGRVECDLLTPSPTVQADPALVRMLLRNLIQNATRHTRASVRVELGRGCLSICDEGEGLPDPMRARLAEDASRSVPEDGLGLFIVRLICERLGWRIQIRSSSAGGTVLDVLFVQEAALAPQGEHAGLSS